jgi:hypothetical protein
MKTIISLFFLLFFSGYTSAQTLLPVEEFNSDILIHGTSAPTNVWFAPNYNTPIDWTATGGCPDGRIGYSSSWNNYWGNFVRLPQINCTGNDTVMMTFDVSHSFFSAHVNDWCRFYVWADSEYKKNVVSVTIDSVDVTYDSGINGKGFKFAQIRSCASVEVLFDLSAIIDKSNILFYIEPSCGYNNSNVFYVWLDNISIKGYSGSTVALNEQMDQEQLFVFPSPAQDFINVKLDEFFEEEVLVEILDLNGKIQYVTLKNNCQEIIQIPVSDLSQGFYCVRISDDRKNAVRAIFLKE